MKIIVCGAGGFIGTHLVASLRADNNYVIGVDLKKPEYSKTKANKFIIGDLRDPKVVKKVVTDDIDQIYQLAADMGGAGYVFTGGNDANILHNSALINLNIAHEAIAKKVPRLLYSSSACVYPEHNQLSETEPLCREDTAYPADPDSDYGFEKLFSERLYMAFARNYGIETKIARLHNIFGPLGSWNNGKEKAPAAVCRKVALALDGGEVEVWGSGTQTRSFLYISQCVIGLQRLMSSNCQIPVNLGSERLISINGLFELVASIAGKKIMLKHVPGPLGVRGRVSHNDLIRKELGWAPLELLDEGLAETYAWIQRQIS